MHDKLRSVSVYVHSIINPGLHYLFVGFIVMQSQAYISHLIILVSFTMPSVLNIFIQKTVN